MQKKKTIVIIEVISMVFLVCFLSAANEPTINPITRNDVNFKSLNASDATNLDFLNEIFDSKSADFSSNGYYSQIYSGSLQATYYALFILDSIGKLDEIDCTECRERFDEEDLLTIDDPSSILTVKEKLAFIRAFKGSE